MWSLCVYLSFRSVWQSIPVTEGARVASSDLAVASPAVHPFHWMHLRLSVGQTASAMIPCSVVFGRWWKFLISAQISRTVENRKPWSWCVWSLAHQYLKLFNSSYVCVSTQVWLHITLLTALITLGANENAHILNTLFADEIFWTLHSSGTDGEHMPSQFVWRAQPRVLPGLGN